MIKLSYQLDPYEMLYLITNILCLLLLWILISGNFREYAGRWFTICNSVHIEVDYVRFLEIGI